MQLRPYQADNIEEIRAHFRAGVRSVLWQLPTGGGKTAGATFMASGAAQRGLTVWFLCHRKELAQQSSDTFKEAGLAHALIAPGVPYFRGTKVQVVRVDTVRRRLDKVKLPDVAIWDECHHLGADTWRELHASMPDTKHIGLSATPYRLQGGGLGEFFPVMVRGPSPAWLIENGYLSKYRLFGTANEPDTSSLHHTAGDFNKREVIELMDRPQVVGDAVDHYLRLANGRGTLLFDVSVESSERQAEAFRAAGIPCVHVDAKTPDIDRRRAIKDLASGDLKILTNVDLFGEGVSVNNVSCIIQKRPTESLSLHLQQIGRGLRTSPGKEDCIILDHAGNWRRHGLPDDKREWSLDGQDKKKVGEVVIGVRQCERCYAAFAVKFHRCPECGWVPAPSIRSVDTVAGELEEVDTEAVRAAKEKNDRIISQAKARDLEGLMRLGHSESRAKHILAAREEKDELRRELRRLNPPLTFKEIQDLKPKGLREWIEKLTRTADENVRPENNLARTG